MAVDSRFSTFPDQEQTEDYLKTLSPRTVRKFWRFVESEPLRRRESSSLSPFDDLKSDSPGVLTSRIFKASQNWKMFTLSPNTFLGRARNLAGDGTMYIFEKLSPKAQKKIWTKKYLGDAPIHCAEREYLELVYRTDLPIDFHEAYGNHDTKWRMRKIKNSVSQPSEEFLKFFNHTFSYGISLTSLPSSGKAPLEFGSYGTESLMMLRYLYGEENVIEMYDRFINAGVPICSSEAIAILDSWDELKSYSIGWIAAINELKH